MHILEITRKVDLREDGRVDDDWEGEEEEGVESIVEHLYKVYYVREFENWTKIGLLGMVAVMPMDWDEVTRHLKR